MNDDLTIKPNIYQPLLDFFRRHRRLIVVISAVLLLAGAYGLGRYSVYRVYPELSGIEKTRAILAKVGALIQLPVGETPTMATINDAVSAKKTQPFLTSAENGDILIVYSNAQQAVLYRPSTNKLIAVGPVNNSMPQQVSSPSQSSALETSSSTHDTNGTTPKK